MDLGKFSDAIDKGRIHPFLDRVKESKLSKFTKIVVNIFFAFVSILNIPILVLAILLFFQEILQVRLLSFTNLQVVLYVGGAWLFLITVWNRSQKYLMSRYIHPLWAFNNKGTIRNIFYSEEIATKSISSVEELVKKQAEAIADKNLKEAKKLNKNLQDTINSLVASTQFPNGTFESIQRIIELLTSCILDPDDERNSYTSIMDRLMTEIKSNKVIEPIIKQGTIMLLDSEGNLTIHGQYNMPFNVIKKKKIKSGEKFAGKVVIDGKVAWVPDVNAEAAQQKYGFTMDPNRVYKGIMGYPIVELGVPYDPFGVIVLHFTDELKLHPEQIMSITKVLAVYGQVVVSVYKLFHHFNEQKRNYGIMALEEVGGGDEQW